MHHQTMLQTRSKAKVWTNAREFVVRWVIANSFNIFSIESHVVFILAIFIETNSMCIYGNLTFRMKNDDAMTIL